MRTIARDIASAVVVSKDGKILMGEKRPGKAAVYADCLHIPGGGVSDGETPTQALARELQEETGLDVTNCKVRLIDGQGLGESVKSYGGEDVCVKMKFFVFEVLVNKTADDIDISEGDDLVNLRWFAPGELASAKLTPPSTALFKRLGYL